MEISDIKQRLSILTVLKRYGIQPDRSNHIKCPFHEDDKPSCKIYPETNTFHCFGCGATGDGTEFIMKKEGITKHEAILKAQDFIGLPSEPKPKPKPIPKPEPTTEQRTKTLTEAFTHFARSLNAKPKKAIEYLECRKLDYKSLSVGYDAGTLHKTKEITAEQKQEYLQAGLLKPDKFGRENSYSTRFSGCIVFPLLDKSGNIASLYGRHTEQGPHYLEGDHNGLYPNYPKPETTRLILTEAIIDAATLLELPEVTKDYSILALYGTNGFTAEHKQAIAELKELKEVVLFFGGDEAGAEASKAMATELKQINEKLQITVVETPEGEDVNSLLQGHEPEIFTHLLENRNPFSFPSRIKPTEKAIIFYATSGKQPDNYLKNILKQRVEPAKKVQTFLHAFRWEHVHICSHFSNNGIG